ncbi:MAG: TolC family protein [Candidatus Acidiferrales bacterium]
MNFRGGTSAVMLFLFSFAFSVRAQTTDSGSRQITLSAAVQLALQHNHVVRIAEFQVEEKQHAKAATKSEYLPTIQNESKIFRLTDTQYVGFPVGSLGSVDGSPLPTAPVTINQGGKTVVISGTTLSEPLTQLLTRIKPANDAAEADLRASRADAQQTQNEVALKVRELYYQILVAQLHRSATSAKIRANQELNSERVQQVKYGNALNEQLIESEAQLLEAKQDLLTTELQISDLTMQLDDVMGLPVATQLTLDSVVPEVQETCAKEECVKLALASHPEVLAARAEVDKASAGVRLAKADFFPDISAFARYNYQSNVPFLVHNFGTFGVSLTYDLFDGGKRRATLGESKSELAQAKENLARVTDDIELGVETALNRLDRTKQMVDVSEQVVALRTESSRVTADQLSRGEALQSQADAANAQELEAKALLLQSQLGYIQAHDELLEAMGTAPQ